MVLLLCGEVSALGHQSCAVGPVWFAYNPTRMSNLCHVLVDDLSHESLHYLERLDTQQICTSFTPISRETHVLSDILMYPNWYRKRSDPPVNVWS